MITFILMEPEEPGNVGAVARVMKNFGFSKLVLINPKCDFRSEEAIRRAKHAGDVIRKAKVKDKRHLSEYNLLVATTAIVGTDYNVARSAITPRQLAEKIGLAKGNVGILIGREGPGLTTEEVAACHLAVTIPSSPKYKTLNISHAVGIICYELFIASGAGTSLDRIELASAVDKKHMMTYIDRILDMMTFPSKEKKEIQRMVWRQLIGKSFITKREAFGIMGTLRALSLKRLK